MNCVCPISPAHAPRAVFGSRSPRSTSLSASMSSLRNSWRAAAVPCERRQRFDGREISHECPEIGLKSPDCHQHRSGNAIFLFDPRKQLSILKKKLRAFFQAEGIDHAPRKLLEGLMKDLLSAITRDDGAIVRHAVEPRLDSARGNACRRGVLPNLSQKVGKPVLVMAAIGRADRQGDQPAPSRRRRLRITFWRGVKKQKTGGSWPSSNDVMRSWHSRCVSHGVKRFPAQEERNMFLKRSCHSRCR